MASLDSIPDDVLYHIGFELTLLDPHGPPCGLLPLLLTSRRLYTALCFNSARTLYASVLRAKFDIRAPHRRLGDSILHTSNLAIQLKKVCRMLNRIRRGDVHSPYLEADLWTAWIMCMENDGRNMARLDWCNIDSLLYDFLRLRLWENREISNGWPAESTINSLAIWLFWFRLDRGKLIAMPNAKRNEISDLVRPFVLTALRYPSFHAPDNHFNFPLPAELQDELPYIFMTPHGFYPLYRDPAALIEVFSHFGLRLKISAPLLAPGAKLLYMTLHETPIPYTAGQPLNREHALALQRTHVHPTVADVDEANYQPSVRLTDHGSPDWFDHLTGEEQKLEDDGSWRRSSKAVSVRWDEDWYRLTGCIDPWHVPSNKGVVFPIGVLAGLWRGRLLVPDMHSYFSLVTATEFPTSFAYNNPRMYTSPLYMRLREHHCINPAPPVRCGGSPQHYDDGVCNAWFPRVETRESNGLVRVWDEGLRVTHTYETYVPERTNTHSPSTCTDCKRRRAQEEAEEQERARATAAAAAAVVERISGSASPTPASLAHCTCSHGSMGEASEAASTSQLDVDGDGDVDMSDFGTYDDPELDDVRKEASGILGFDVDEMIDEEMGSEFYDDGDSDSEDEYADNADDIDEDKVRGVHQCDGVCDIIVTGETLPRHGQAWNHYRYYGRVRRWDGLVSIVRIPLNNPALGTYIFRGYIVGGQNFVGSWRAWTNNFQAIPLEGPFIMRKAQA